MRVTSWHDINHYSLSVCGNVHTLHQHNNASVSLNINIIHTNRSAKVPLSLQIWNTIHEWCWLFETPTVQVYCNRTPNVAGHCNRTPNVAVHCNRTPNVAVHCNWTPNVAVHCNWTPHITCTSSSKHTCSSQTVIQNSKSETKFRNTLLGQALNIGSLINSLMPELNPSTQRCLTRFFYWGFCFLNRAFC
jgi:hypothetical protein